MFVTGILASDVNGLIASSDDLPWHYPEDLQFFYNTTVNKAILMGSKTYALLPKKYKLHFFCIVLTRSVSAVVFKNNVVYIPSLDHLHSIDLNARECYMIGGAQVADLCIQKGIVNKFYLTLMHDVYTGDTFFSIDLLKNWSRELIFSCNNYNRYLLIK